MELSKLNAIHQDALALLSECALPSLKGWLLYALLSGAILPVFAVVKPCGQPTMGHGRILVHLACLMGLAYYLSSSEPEPLDSIHKDLFSYAGPALMFLKAWVRYFVPCVRKAHAPGTKRRGCRVLGHLLLCVAGMTAVSWQITPPIINFLGARPIILSLLGCSALILYVPAAILGFGLPEVERLGWLQPETLAAFARWQLTFTSLSVWSLKYSSVVRPLSLEMRVVLVMAAFALVNVAVGCGHLMKRAKRREAPAVGTEAEPLLATLEKC